MPRIILHSFVLIAAAFPAVTALAVDDPAGAPGGGQAPAADALTFSRDIAPIIFENCATCHRPGESAPFSLLTYRDVRKRAEQIVEVTGSRFMPPWLPEPGFGDLEGERRLGDEQVAMIEQWTAQGAVEGEPSDLPPMPKWTDGWQLGEPDLAVKLEQPYILQADGTDVFRNFVIPIPVQTTRYVKAVELRPGNSKIVHHAVMRTDRKGSARQLDLRDDEPGFGGMNMGGSEMPDGHLLGWTPGKMPYAGADDMAWRLDPGMDLVLQMHMLPTGKREPVAPVIGFFFTDQPPTRRPFEIRLGPRDIDIPAGEKAYRLEDNYTLPVDVEVLGIYPHAHYLGKDMKAYAVLPDGTRRWLIRIKDWDFNWQDDYRYAEPFGLPRGARIVMEYTYDNSADNVRNPNNPPRRVIYGWRSTDEMADMSLQVVPRDPRELATLERDMGEKNLRQDIAGFEVMLKTDPDNGEAHNLLASAYVNVGRMHKAIPHLRRAIEIDPANANAHNTLGTALQAKGKLDEAMVHYRAALQARPDYAEAHNNLALGLHIRNDRPGAIEHTRKAIRLKPDYAEAHYNLAFFLAASGRLEDVSKHVREALRLKNSWSAAALTNFALLLSTHEDPTVRDPKLAVDLARRACNLTSYKNVDYLDALAAAYAADGHFESAIATVDSAIKLAEKAQSFRRAERIMERKKLYERKEPHRQKW